MHNFLGQPCHYNTLFIWFDFVQYQLIDVCSHGRVATWMNFGSKASKQCITSSSLPFETYASSPPTS